MKNHHPTSGEPASPRVGRRTLLKASVAAAAAPFVVTPRKADAQLPPVLPPSPPTTPWVEELPLQDTPVTPLASLTPAPTLTANIAGGEIGRAEHQRFTEICGPGSRSGRNPVFHKLVVKENPSWRFNGDNDFYPPQPIWGYQGTNNTAAGPPSMRATASRSSAASSTSCRRIMPASARPRSRRTCTTCTPRPKATASPGTTTARPVRALR
jgi:hypothetical protein